MKKFKNLIYVALLALTIFTCQISTNLGVNIFASTQYTQYKTVTVTNGSFNSSTSYSLDSSPTGWSANSGSSTKGIIGVDDTSSKFSNNCTAYKLETTENPSKVGADYKVLMINAKTSTNTTEPILDYFTSNDISLSSYSYYKVSVWVQTMNNATASVVLAGLSDNDIATATSAQYHSGIQTTDGTTDWQEYSFYIQTSYETPTIKIKLYLGNVTSTSSVKSSGVAFFDEVSVIQCSQNYYQTQKTAEINANNWSEITFNQYTINAGINLDFENNLQDWTLIGNYPDETVYTANTVNVASSELGSDFSYLNTKALMLSADEDNALYVGYQSKPITINSAQVYRITVMVKTSEVSGNVYVKLTETDYLKENYGFTDHEVISSTISLQNTESNQLTNDYQKVSFYISGYELYNTQVQLELSLGNEDATAYGTVMFDSITIQMYPYNEFSDLSDGNTAKKVNFTKITGTPTITNGFFNDSHSEEVETTYPLTPNGWTQSAKTNDSSNVFGVVDVSKWDSIPTDKRPSDNPLSPSLTLSNQTVYVLPTSANNILMAYNKASSYQTITSPNFTVSADLYYTLSFNYLAYGNDILNIKVLDSDNNIIYQDLGLNSNTSWKYYKITIKTEYFSSTLKFVFDIGTETDNKLGYVFFDNFQLDQETNYTAQTYAGIVNNDENVLDFSDIGMHLVGTQFDGIKMYDSLMFSGKLESGTQPENSEDIGYGGIINENNDFNLKFPTNHTSSVQNMLAIRTLANCEYSLTSKETLALTSGSYYKFSIYIKTIFSGTHPDEEESDYGAYFSLVGIDDAQIKNIKSNNSFNEFVVYVKCDDDANVNIKLGFASDCEETIGVAFFDSFAFETINKTVYENSTPSGSVAVVNMSATTDETDTEDTASEATPANIWIMLSTIIMVIAMIIATVGGLLRKVEIKKIKVKKQADYDRQVVLVRDASVNEAEKRRDTEIKQLQKEKEDLQNYLTELEEDNKNRIAEQRRQFGREITRKAEKEFKIYASARQKIARDIERTDDRIKEARTPEYLMRIVKIVQTEKVKDLQNKEILKTDTEPNSETNLSSETNTTKPSTDK